MNILVMHVSYHSSIGVIKQLRKIDKYNIKIIGCSSIKQGYNPGTVLTDIFYQTPNPSSNEYLGFVTNICKLEKIDFIFSPEEEDFRLFTINKINLNCIYANIDILDTFQNKHHATNILKNLGILTPKIIKNNYVAGKDYIARKYISTCSKGIKIFNFSEKINKTLFDKNEYFIQEFIDGTEYTVDVLTDKNGNPIIIIPRIRIKVRTGITVTCIIDKNAKIIETTKLIYKHFKIPGFSNVQFIVKDGEVYFIELNPRIGGTTIASSLASINLIELYLDHYYFSKELKNFEYYMNKVKWGSIISRYYEETIY